MNNTYDDKVMITTFMINNLCISKYNDKVMFVISIINTNEYYFCLCIYDKYKLYKYLCKAIM